MTQKEIISEIREEQKAMAAIQYRWCSLENNKFI